MARKDQMDAMAKVLIFCRFCPNGRVLPVLPFEEFYEYVLYHLGCDTCGFMFDIRDDRYGRSKVLDVWVYDEKEGVWQRTAIR